MKEVGGFVPCSSRSRSCKGKDEEPEKKIQELMDNIDDGLEEFKKSDWKMGMATTVYLKGIDGAADLEKKLVSTLTESVSGGKSLNTTRDVPCETRVDRLDADTWAVHVTPMKAGLPQKLLLSNTA